MEEELSLEVKHVKSVQHDLCPWPPRPSPQTTKDFWVIVLPPAGVPSQSFTRLMPEEDTKRQDEKNILSFFELHPLTLFCAEKRVFHHPPFLSSPQKSNVTLRRLLIFWEKQNSVNILHWGLSLEFQQPLLRTQSFIVWIHYLNMIKRKPLTLLLRVESGNI